MNIVFIRHGETTGDVEDRYGGDYDDHLSEKGITQVEELLLELKDQKIEMIISSSLIRAVETSKIISKLGCPMVIEKSFRERNQYGLLSGMIKGEAKNKFPDLVEKLKDRMNTIDGAESYKDFSERIKVSLNNLILENKYSCVAVVWHGGPMRVLFRDILKKGELKKIGDCAWVKLEYIDNKFFIHDFERIELDNII